MLSGDVSINPGPNQDPQLDSKTWSIFKKRGLHFLHININSLLPKIEEIRYIANLSNVSAICITESKLDHTISNSEIKIEGYDLIRCDRNRNGGGVLCFIKDNLHFNQIHIFGNDIENIFFEILLPNSQPITIGCIYRPPNQHDFLEKIHDDF